MFLVCWPAPRGGVTRETATCPGRAGCPRAKSGCNGHGLAPAAGRRAAESTIACRGTFQSRRRQYNSTSRRRRGWRPAAPRAVAWPYRERVRNDAAATRRRIRPSRDVGSGPAQQRAREAVAVTCDEGRVRLWLSRAMKGA